MESPASIMKTLSDERRFTDIFIAIPENNAIKTVQHFPVFRALQECISCIVFWDYKRKIGWGVKKQIWIIIIYHLFAIWYIKIIAFFVSLEY